MFERLIQSLGQPANQTDGSTVSDGELQLAAAILLYGTLPVDHQVAPEETAALLHTVQALFHLSEEKSHRLIARAAAAVAKDPGIMASATMLKHRSSEAFRLRLLQAMELLIHADGQLHHNELDRAHRTRRLLGLAPNDVRQSA